MLSDFLVTLFGALLSPLPEDWSAGILDLGMRDRIFLGVAAAIAFLFLLSVVLAVWVYLRRSRMDELDRKRIAFERLLRPHILRAIAGEIPPGDVGALVPPAKEMQFLLLLLDYVDKVKGVERDLVHALAKRHLRAAVSQVRARSPEKRARAVRCLGVLGLPDHEDSLLEALDDPSAEVSLVGAHALAATGDVRYAPQILARLHRYERWSPRYLAEMLASMGGEVVPALAALSMDEAKSSTVRAVAADAMRLIGYPEAADTAARILERCILGSQSADRETRIAALRILGALGRPEHLTLVRHLARDPDLVIREFAVRALGSLGTREDLPLLVGELNGPSRWVALEAARSIRALQEVGEAEGEIHVIPERAQLFHEVLEG